MIFSCRGDRGRTGSCWTLGRWPGTSCRRGAGAEDSVTQLTAAIRKVGRVVPGAGQMIAGVCALDYGKPGKPPIDWDDPAAKEQLVSDLVNDALAVLGALAGPDAPQRGDAEADALGLLALVAGQAVEPAADSDGTDGRRRIAPKA